MRFVFFSMHNFIHDGGGSIRMYGILNALAEKDCEVIFISNATQKKNFHPSICHIPIGTVFSSKQKALFQFLLSLLPVSVVELLYSNFFKRLTSVINKTVKDKEPVYFFEYLDNSIGYALKKIGIIFSYIGDNHGVAPLEFKMQMELSSNIQKKMLYFIKYISAKALDKKVFKSGSGFIFASSQMKKYFESTINLNIETAFLIPYLLDKSSTRAIYRQLRNKLLEQFEISTSTFVFLFTGSYKATSGVDNLIQAFQKVNNIYSNTKLLLIGKGKFRKQCEELAVGYQNKIFFLDGFPYDELYTYQSIANVIVCPDKMNPYSDMIIHLKYFDALASGKLVINGNFESVKEINKENLLSLTFEPSNVESLYETMKQCIDNYNGLVIKYKEVNKYTLEHLTYDAYINVLIEYQNKSNRS